MAKQQNSLLEETVNGLNEHLNEVAIGWSVNELNEYIVYLVNEQNCLTDKPINELKQQIINALIK